MNLDPALEQALGALDQTYEKTDVSSGGGGMANFPPEGEHDCAIIGLEVTANTYKWRDGPEAGVPCIQFRFEYTRFVDPNDPEYDENNAEINFKGASARLVTDQQVIASLPEGNRTQQEIALGRVKGLLAAGLGRDPSSSILADAKELAQNVASAASPTFILYAEHKADSRDASRIYKTEYARTAS